MKEEIPKNFKFCELSLFIANKTLLEITSILFHKSKEFKPISKSDTFRFYLFTLHSTFILEITKLMEIEDERRSNNHFASLQKINKKILNIKGNDYSSKFLNNLKKIELIRQSPIFKKILTLRDSKIAHIDKNKKVKPFEFESFSNREIQELFEILNEIKSILNNCLSVYGGEYYLPTITRTANLLTFFEEYRAFAHSRPVEFWKWKSENYKKSL
ncbi:hypothetical protein [Shivajiella indica]|uniref:HEPN AbiU2-like domain-containing protein n=1 Tax=Shivajiella indica TaxID=872115 RepID=A0ABW5BBZ2_9BACT